MSKVNTYITNQYVYFYKKESPFSQHYPCVFFWLPENHDQPLRFTSTEQWMMYQKAMLFGDLSIAMKIINESSPQKCKMLGRKVNNFSKVIWDNEKLKIVHDGNVLKFYQNPKLFSALLNVGDRRLAEASPTDRIWGIGKGIDDPHISNYSEWGQNLLGEILTNIKDYAIKNTKEAIQF